MNENVTGRDFYYFVYEIRVLVTPAFAIVGCIGLLRLVTKNKKYLTIKYKIHKVVFCGHSISNSLVRNV